MYPHERITKGQVLDYYHRISPYLLLFSKNRPISMQRFPDGIDAHGFYQKEASDYFPDFIKRVDVPLREEDKINHQVYVNDASTLIYLVNQGMITLHLWLSRIDKLECPDRLIFDLDPPNIKSFPLVVSSARRLRDLCAGIGLTPYPMLTGSKGLHLVIPIVRNWQYPEVKAFARSVAELFVQKYPKHVTLELHKEKRKGKIFLDVLRNEYGQTAVAPFSLRPLKAAPVATPLSWHEVNGKLQPQKYTLKNIFRRVSRIADPWEAMDDSAAALSEAQKNLNAML